MSKKILLVDDDQDFTMMNEAVLVNLGYEVATASSAQEGLDKLKEFKPDLVILDLMMEHYDSGFTLSHRIKTNPDTKDIPLVMVTSVRRETEMVFDARTHEEKEWIKVDGFLEKPISPEDLSATVTKYIK
ncbi:MAG: response regulator [Firmicutes bacterium]|nr:response regulator [Bacillota bacterium]